MDMGTARIIRITYIPMDIYCCFVFDLNRKLRSFYASSTKRQVNAFMYMYPPPSRLLRCTDIAVLFTSAFATKDGTKKLAEWHQTPDV